MHVALLEEFVDRDRGDTEISVPVVRRRVRRKPSQRTAPEPSEERVAPYYPYVDPGNTLAGGSALAITLREATVRRNHRSAPAPEANPCPQVEIAWARARDDGLSLRRIGSDAISIRGTAAGRTQAPRHPTLSLGIDGVAFTVPVGPDEPAQVCGARLAARLSTHYQVEITNDSAGGLLLRLASHT